MSQTKQPLPRQPLVENDLNPSKTAAAAPRWVALLGALVLGVVFLALPAKISLGPGWLPLTLEIILLIPIMLAHRAKHPFSQKVIRIFAFSLLGVVTLALISGVILMIVTLPSRTEIQAGLLLRTAALLWIANILVFALWYWEIDGGGPLAREKSGHKASDFMFPQQVDGNTTGWAPHFFDYVFLSFTGATALSPADTFPLTRSAKVLMMIEALVALVVLAIIIGRGVNIL